VIHRILVILGALPGALIYVVLGAGAAVENVIPPVPADTFVLLGAFLAARGAARLWLVFLVTWTGNVASALVVYGLARKYGKAFFNRRVGHWLLHPRQLEQISLFYERWGELAIVASRFLPGFRATVPVFVPARRLSGGLRLRRVVWRPGVPGIARRSEPGLDHAHLHTCERRAVVGCVGSAARRVGVVVADTTA
jgi:membrane protein YqaA with SNARE-associated domain